MDCLSSSALRKVSKDIMNIRKTPIEDIELLESDNLQTIEAIIRGPDGTPYQGGRFHMRLLLGRDFPQQPPRGQFRTKIFHPNVSADGDICVNTLKRDWRPSLGIKHILLVVRCLLIAPNPESALNEEAGRQLMEDYTGYARHARLFTQLHAMKDDGAGAGGGTRNNLNNNKENEKNEKNINRSNNYNYNNNNNENNENNENTNNSNNNNNNNSSSTKKKKKKNKKKNIGLKRL